MRAYLTVRPESVAGLDAASAPEADALVIDLTGIDAMPPAPTGDAPGRPHGRRLFARIGTVDGPAIASQLSTAMAWRPDAIVLPAAHGRDIAHLGARLAVQEAENGRPDGTTRVVALIASAAGALHAASLAGASPRLVAIGWDAGAIAPALRADRLDEAGEWSPPLAQVRALVRLAAAAAGVEAIEAAYPGDDGGFARHLAAARRDGFGAVLTWSPAQVERVREASASGRDRAAIQVPRRVAEDRQHHREPDEEREHADHQ